jgi:hypothetical protein
VARDLLAASLERSAVTDHAAEAKRQSILVTDHESEREALRFITDAADLRGWE